MSESEIKLPFTQTVGKIIAGIALVVAVGGYILFFQSQGRVRDITKTADEAKEKQFQAEAALSELKTKYNNIYDDMKKMGDDSQNNKLRAQDCQQKLEALEIKYDTLSRQAATAPAPSTSDHPAAAPAEEPKASPAPTTPTDEPPAASSATQSKP